MAKVSNPVWPKGSKQSGFSNKNGMFKIAGKNGEIPMLFSVIAVKHLQRHGSM